MAERMEFEFLLRGVFRLLAHIQDGSVSAISTHAQESRIHECRLIQQRLAENLPAFLKAGTSPANAALRAEVEDAFARLSLRLTGRSFESFARDLPAIVPGVLDPSAFITLSDVALTSEAYRNWLGNMVAQGRIRAPEVMRMLEQWTLQLLPLLDPAERGPILQRLYDAGLIFNLDLRLSLDGVYLSRADLTEALLARVYLARANLRGGRLVGANLNGATLRYATLITAQMGCTLLRDADLRDAEMAGASLLCADVCGTNFTGANLVKAVLRKADATGAIFADANLLGSHLEDTVLTGADMRNANLLWADLSGATLDGAYLAGALYNAHSRWPLDFVPQAHAMVIID